MWLFCLALQATVLFGHIWQNLDSKLATESFVTCSPTRPPPHLKHSERTLSRAHAVAMVTAVNGRVLPAVLGGELTVTSESILLLEIISYLNRFWYEAVSCCFLCVSPQCSYVHRKAPFGCIILLILDQLSVKEAQCLWNPSVGLLWTDSSWFEVLMLQLIIRRLLLPSSVSLCCSSWEVCF